MTLDDIATILESTGYPVSYYDFDEAPSFPCICYKENDRNPIKADDGIVENLKNIRIEVYSSKHKSLEAEQAVEAVLSDNGIIYDFTDVGRIEDESLYEVTYDIQI